jgi:hypothetical protein
VLKEELCLFFSKERRVLLLFYVNNFLVIYYNCNAAKGKALKQAIKDAYKIKDKGNAV